MEIFDAKTLLNDGTGKATPLSLLPATFGIAKSLHVDLIEEPKDVLPPFSFTPKVGQSRDLFDGKYFIIFNTLDADSGVDHYELYESQREFKVEELTHHSEIKWRRSENPAALSDQTLRSFVYVKAVDRSGNSRIEIISPGREGKGNTWSFNIRLASGILVITVVAFLAWFFLRRKKYV